MANRCVLVHSCFNPQLGPRPELCGCNYWITRAQAELMVRSGEGHASFLHEEDGSLKLQADGKPIREAKHIAVPKAVRTPRAPTIEKAHIERAFVFGDSDEQVQRAQRERERIEAYGAQGEARWHELGAGMRLRGTISPGVRILEHQPNDSPCVVMWGSDLTKAENPAGKPEQGRDDRSDCRFCGEGITRPETYPRLDLRADAVQCPFCLTPKGIPVPPMIQVTAAGD